MLKHHHSNGAKQPEESLHPDQAAHAEHKQPQPVVTLQEAEAELMKRAVAARQIC